EDGHIAVNEADELIYAISGDGSEIRTYDMLGNLLLATPISGLSRTVAVVYDPADGQLFVGSQSQDVVYKLDPTTGTHTVFAPNAPVNGGDIFIIDNEVFLIERVNGGSSKLYNITSGVPIFETFVATSVNGASATAANGFIVSSGNYSSSFYTYDADGSN